MEAVSIVTIKNKIPLYKKDEEANAIELVELEEVGYEIVAQKNLYTIGDKAVLILPDYCLPDLPLFESYIRPNGDESKSMLGKVGGLARRIRAKKFNLSKSPNGVAVYSNGILLPIFEVENELEIVFDSWKNITLTEALNITKYEAPEDSNLSNIKSGKAKPFPEGVYKTDETNINSLWSHIENHIGYPVTLIGTEKIDGSSITIGIKNNKGFICSRNLQKPLIIKKHAGRRKKTFLERLMFWTNPDLNLYQEVENDDDFVKYGKPYLDKLIEANLDNVILRGELNGGSLKGSGNKNNPSSKLPVNIQFFGLDSINESGLAEKAPHSLLETVCATIGATTVKKIFLKEFNSREEIEKECETYFEKNLIEGIVIRTLDNSFSAKYMNLEYDSKK